MQSYKRSFRGKSTAAALIDAFFFAGISAFAVYILLRKSLGSYARLLLSASAFIFILIALDLVQKIRFQKHTDRLRAETRLELFKEKLLCMDETSFGSAVLEAVDTQGSDLAVFQKKECVSADDVYRSIRRCRSPKLVIVSVSYPDVEAMRVIERIRCPGIRFVSADDLPVFFECCSPDEAEVDRTIIESNSLTRKKRNVFKLLFRSDRAAKYLLLACFLYAASFFSSRAPYLRILASAIISAAALIRVKDLFLRRPERA